MKEKIKRIVVKVVLKIQMKVRMIKAILIHLKVILMKRLNHQKKEETENRIKRN